MLKWNRFHQKQPLFSIKQTGVRWSFTTACIKCNIHLTSVGLAMISSTPSILWRKINQGNVLRFDLITSMFLGCTMSEMIKIIPPRRLFHSSRNRISHQKLKTTCTTSPLSVGRWESTRQLQVYWFFKPTAKLASVSSNIIKVGCPKLTFPLC